MRAIQGIDAKLMYKVGGQSDGGSWTELVGVMDLKAPGKPSETKLALRGMSGWAAFIAGLKELSVEFEMLWDPTNAGLLALRDAWTNNAMIGIQCLDETSGKGVQADVQVFDFSRNQPAEGVQTISIVLKPCVSDTPPSEIG